MQFERWMNVGCWLSMGVSFAGVAIAPCDRVAAQIIPDGTLPQNSIVTPQGNLQRITGGTQAGENLFHSFSEFNVRTGETAHFENIGAIDNIITRVTGGQFSNIDGLIRTNGSANLFLVNPNGILFGANAQLDVGGSFVASTASGVRFADGSEFATTSSDTPLLTVSVPVGLQFNSETSGRIDVSGSELFVPTGQTLALIGSDISISGGQLVAGGLPRVEIEGVSPFTTPGGRIELGGIREGEVNFTRSDRGLSFEYGIGADFSNIQLTQAAFLDVSGIGSGDIQVVARNLEIIDGSGIFAYTLGSLPGGDITVRASESVEIVGTGDFSQALPDLTADPGSPNTPITGLFNITFDMGDAGTIFVETPELIARNNASIFTGVLGTGAGNVGVLSIDASERIEVTAALVASTTGSETTGDGGDIALSTPELLVRDNGLIATTAFSEGRGGDLTITADEIRLVRAQPVPINQFVTIGTAISASTLDSGDGGNLTIDTRTLELRDSAQITTGAIGSGRAGNLTVNASESIELRGGQTVTAMAASNIGFNTGMIIGSVTGGDSGNLSLTTPRLTLRDGAFIAANTFGAGAGGTLEIDADVIELSGMAADSGIPTDISAGSVGFFGAGDAGNVEIETRQLVVREGAQIVVSSQGNGRAGNLEVIAEEILLDRSGELSATTTAGERGNITLNAGSVQLLEGSLITTDATGEATGGNITINSDTLVALENSDITANAEESFGGRVTIETQGLFGTEFREELTPNSDITATSELGGEFSGTVTIITPDIDPSSGLVELSSATLDAGNTIARSCLTPSSRQQGRFTVVGAGGLPTNPDNPIASPFETFAIPSVSSQEREKIVSSGALVEAQGIFHLEDDRFVLGRLCGAGRPDRS
ncbi:MAG: S-layer family protein [Cyanobacteriota bacterium]|nr:S-layer family protein [Cyanobacteriota bacterium]